MALRVTSVTRSRGSAPAGRAPSGASAPTANQASGVSPAAGAVSATATQTSVTPKQENAETVGTTPQDTSVNGQPSSLSPPRHQALNKRVSFPFPPTGVRTASMETRCSALENTVSPAPAPETRDQITLTDIPANLTTLLIRLYVTVIKATLVSKHKAIRFRFCRHVFLIFGRFNNC